MSKTMEFADAALYPAKHQGRNKVVRFITEMWTEQDYQDVEQAE